MAHDSTVSNKVTEGLFQFARQRGVAAEDLIKQISNADLSDPHLRPEAYLDRRKRMPWNSFISLLDAIRDELPDHEARLDYMREAAFGENTWIPYVQFLNGLVSSPLQAYRINNRLIGPSAFGSALVTDLEVLEDGRYLVTGRIAEGYRDSRLFWEVSHAGMQILPNWLGLPDSSVEAEIKSREARYVITPPPSLTIWARLSRAFRQIFFAATALEELTRQDRQLRISYDRLLVSERDLRRARTELEERINQMQKLEAIGTLTGGLSHEINNVLHGILLSLEAPSTRIEDPQLRDRVQSARDFAMRGQDLVRRVLAFSRKSPLKSEPLQLPEVVIEAMRLMRSTLKKNITLNVDVKPNDEICVIGDSTQLHQLLINICLNSAYAMRDKGGTLTVTLSRQDAGADSRARLSIRDTGEGIATKNIERIFEPFFTTKPVGQGTGMGLAVVQAIVESMHGTIVVNSESMRGAEFIIELPLTSCSDELGEPSEIGGSERLLLIDCDTEVLALLRDTLSAFGYNIETVSSEQEARTMLMHGTFDLVLSGKDNDDSSGLQTATRLREEFPNVRFLLCADANHSRTPTNFAVGITRPLDAFSLNTSIRELLNR